MTLFEYLSVAVSIVLSLSAAQILANIRAALQHERRYWVHTVWMFIALYTHVVLWWEFWAYRDVAQWTLAKFLLVLVNPGLLFVGSHALSTPDPGNDSTWEEHYFSVRWSFFVPFGVLIFISFFRDAYVLGRPIEVSRHIPEALFLVVCVVAARSQSRRTHSILALVSLLALVASTVSLWIQPGGGSRV